MQSTLSISNIFRTTFISTVQTNLHNDFITSLKSIEKQKSTTQNITMSTIRVIEPCSHSEHDRTIICHENITYNYADILAVSNA